MFNSHCPDFLEILHKERLRKCCFSQTTEKAQGHLPGTCKHITGKKKMKPEHFQWHQVSVQEAGDTHQNRGCSLSTSEISFFMIKLVKHRPGLLRDAVDLLQRNAKCN